MTRQDVAGKGAVSGGKQPLNVSKKLAFGDVFRQSTFPLRFQLDRGKTRKGTLPCKASKSTAHVAVR